MRMRMVSFVVAQRFEEVLQVVGDEVEAPEKEEDRHGEAGQDLSPLQSKGMPNTAPPPNLKVAQNVNGDADGRAPGVEEDKVRERHGSERSL